MHPLRVAVRAIVAFLYLCVTTRVSGKRVVNQATPFDFIVALIIGDLIDDALWAEVSMMKFGVAVASIFVCDAIVKLIAFRSLTFFRWVNGTPSIVLRDGVEDEQAMRQEQLNDEDLERLLRLQDVVNWRDVRLAVLDRDHEISVIRRPGAEPLQKKDLQVLKDKLKQ